MLKYGTMFKVGDRVRHSNRAVTQLEGVITAIVGANRVQVNLEATRPFYHTFYAHELVLLKPIKVDINKKKLRLNALIKIKKEGKKGYIENFIGRSTIAISLEDGSGIQIYDKKEIELV